MSEKKKSVCPLDCPDTCSVIATIENGRVTRLDGDPDHPNTDGFLCKKMRRYPERVESLDRILYPQVRIGKKGEGKFRRITWDEAWDLLVTTLKERKERFGGDSLLPYSYAGNMGVVNKMAGYPFFHRYGATQLDQTICAAGASGGWKAHCGSVGGSSPERAQQAELIVVWGVNVKVTNVHFWPQILKSKRNGGKLVVIDPYRNITAKGADHYFQVHPGGDGALALGLLKILIEEKAQDQAFIDQATQGFETLRDYVVTLSWKAIEEQSGMPQSQIGSLAKLLIQHRKTFIRVGVGLSRTTRGANSVRAIACLAAALGLFDQQEGRGILLFSGAFNGDNEKVAYRGLLKPPTRMVNMIHLGQALNTLNPPIKTLFVYNSNPLSVAPDASMVRKGLEREDLFTIVHEQVMTPTAKYADLLLPATTTLENQDLYRSYGHFYLASALPVIPPRGESCSNFDLFQNLARRMGYTDAPFQQRIEDRIQDFLANLDGVPEGVDPQPLVKQAGWIRSKYEIHEGPLFDGKNHTFHFVSQNLGVDQPVIPCLIQAQDFDNPNLKARYPFQLITPPNGDLLNSTFADRFAGQIGEVLIHPNDAAKMQIQAGDSVRLYNDRGATIRTAIVTEDSREGLLVAEGIYYAPEEYTGAGINDLTSQHGSDIGGGGTFHESLVAIQRI